jgi:putative SOS response-associated peptidase YedK
MCGRYTASSSPEDLAAFFDVDELRTEALPPSYNVAPTSTVYAVALSRHRRDVQPTTNEEVEPHRVLGAFRWGLVPFWAEQPSSGAKMINARAEGITTRPAFRKAIARRRCLIPADAFYEWRRRTKSDGRPAGKLPYAIMRRDGGPMAFGGIWELWKPKDQPDAEPLRTCAIVTTTANSLMAPIHDRMPLVLGSEAWTAWLEPATDMTTVQGLMVPAPSEWFCAYPVGTRVNKVTNDGPDLLDPLPDPPAGVLDPSGW